MITRLFLLSVVFGLVRVGELCAQDRERSTEIVSLGQPTLIAIEPYLKNVAPTYRSAAWNPSFGEVTGDDKIDLILGVAYRGSKKCGRALVLPNGGSRHRPEYQAAFWLDEAVLTARIPGG